jgi:formate--tetrahydrofolate ligase
MTVTDLAQQLHLRHEHVLHYGQEKAKIHLEALQGKGPRGKLILVSAITPTPAGEGKTTVSIGLAQGLKHIGQSVALALRQPSMGPVFGRKGGATGGGLSRIVPGESINLHFTGDFHAVTSAHNLLASIVDNALFQGQTRLDPQRVLWKRVLDMNDRTLRRIRIGGGKDGPERQTGFDITAASEVMAVLCLSESLTDLRARLSRMVVGYTNAGEPVLAQEFKCIGAMVALLKDALMPNLVTSLEGVPAFVHGGPFANIAHGCNSVIATRMALAHADYAVTEAGFAFDLGGEKFMHIKCRQSGLAPEAIVLVATVRALKMHGGVPLTDLTLPNVAAVQAGLSNLAAHVDAAKHFQRPIIIAVNQFHQDHADEMQAVHEWCRQQDIPSATANVFGKGGPGAADLAQLVVQATSSPTKVLPFLYDITQSVPDKLHAIASRIYGATDVILTDEAQSHLTALQTAGYAQLPLCMAKTQNSLSDDATKLGRPRNFSITVRGFEIAAGAGFLVALTGTMMRMPAMPKVPAAERVDVATSGEIVGV